MPKRKALSGKPEIVEVAFRLVQEEGEAALSTRRLAKEMQVSNMTFYNYIKNIDELRKEIILKAFNILYSSAYERLKAMNESGERKQQDNLRYLAKCLYDFALDYPNIFLLIHHAKKDIRCDREVSHYYDYFLRLLQPRHGTNSARGKALHMLGHALSSMLAEMLIGARKYDMEQIDAYIDVYMQNAALQTP